MQTLSLLPDRLARCEILRVDRVGDGILTLTLRSEDLPGLFGGRPVPPSALPATRSGEEDLRLRPELQKAIAFIQDNLGRSLSLPEIARAAGLSECYTARLFKQAMGQTLHQYILRQRIETAKALLQQGDLSLAQIATAVGFYDQAHFTNYFKRLTGMTPRAAMRHS